MSDSVETTTSFHARHSAVRKTYRYRISTSEQPTDFEQRFTWLLPDYRGFPDLPAGPVELSTSSLTKTLLAATGWHDFSLLAHPNAAGKPLRLLPRAQVETKPAPGGGKLHEITLSAPGFIRHQIRNIVGVAVTAGLGRLPDGEMDRLLSGKGDRWRGARAPGRGLTLWSVEYRCGENPFPVDDGLWDVDRAGLCAQTI